MLLLVWLSLKVKNDIRNSLINGFTMWTKSNDSNYSKIEAFLTKRSLTNIDIIIRAILKEVSVSETIKWCWAMNKKTFIYFFSKITVVWHV